MGDLISRQAAIDILDDFADNTLEVVGGSYETARRKMCGLPSAQPEIIHCEDCKWWEKMKLNDKQGYCHAAKHAHYSANWEISIYRTTSQSFFCADAERREYEAD